MAAAQKLMMVAFVVVVLLLAAGPSAAQDRDDINLIFETMLDIDRTNSSYSDHMMRFIVRFGLDEPEDMSSSDLAAMVTSADLALEVARVMHEFCETFRKHDLAELVKNTRCDSIDDDSAFVRERRARALDAARTDG